MIRKKVEMASNTHQNNTRKINLILLGKPGEGKSATGNSILGRSAFPTSVRKGTKSSICTLESAERDGNLIRVVDTPGMLSSEDPTKFSLHLISQALSLCTGNIDAFLLVITFGNKYTSTDIKCLNNLKAGFGENFTRDSGLIVFTHCDYFEASYENKSPTMKDWIDQTIRHEKDAPFAQLLEMFNYRYVQFYNTGDPYSYKRELGVAKLFEMIQTKYLAPFILPSIKTEESKNSFPQQVMNIVLLGKTGNGKSATGNTILDWSAFLTCGSTASRTKVAKLQCGEKDGTLIKVVDTPGLMDTEDPIKATLSQISQAMSFCPEGFNALIFVLKYGCRFTNEEKTCLEILKKHFGINFLKYHGVVVVTNGDGFDMDYEGTDMTYKEYLKQGHDEQFSKLASECNNRIILMYNQKKHCVDERKQCRAELLRIIREDIPMHYKSEHFETAKCIREIIEQFEGPLFNRHIQENLSLLICQMETDSQNNTLSYEDTIAKFGKLYEAVSEFSIAKKRNSLKEKLEIIQRRFQGITSIQDAASQNSELLCIRKELKALKDTPDSANCLVLKAFNTCASIIKKIALGLNPYDKKQYIDKQFNKVQKSLREYIQGIVMTKKYHLNDSKNEEMRD